MRMRQKLDLLFKGMFGVIGLFVLVWIASVLPFTAAIDPELPSNWQKFVEFCIDVVSFANNNITLIVLLFVGIFGGGYLAITKTSKK